MYRKVAAILQYPQFTIPLARTGVLFEAMGCMLCKSKGDK
jgi:hypothetical protein